MKGGRDHEEELFQIINEGAAPDGGQDDGLEFLKKRELEQSQNLETSNAELYGMLKDLQ
jgi:hypothetical protein